MKIYTLMENTACCDDLLAEHGLSLYIEACGKKLLFDMGQTHAFTENAKKMGVDLTQVDLAVLSHGHYDHAGGLEAFLSINPTAPVYISRHAPEPHYNAAGHYIGMDSSLAGHPRIHLTDDIQVLAPGICLYSCNTKPRPFPTDTYGLTVLDQPEDFRHEQYLLIEEQGKRVLFSGCSHKGILNIVEWFRPDVLIGGFHFMKLEPDSPILTDTATALLDYNCTYYTCHCTGNEQFHRMKSVMSSRLFAIQAGTVLEL